VRPRSERLVDFDEVLSFRSGSAVGQAVTKSSPGYRENMAMYPPLIRQSVLLLKSARLLEVSTAMSPFEVSTEGVLRSRDLPTLEGTKKPNEVKTKTPPRRMLPAAVTPENTAYRTISVNARGRVGKVNVNPSFCSFPGTTR